MPSHFYKVLLQKLTIGVKTQTSLRQINSSPKSKFFESAGKLHYIVKSEAYDWLRLRAFLLAVFRKPKLIKKGAKCPIFKSVASKTTIFISTSRGKLTRKIPILSLLSLRVVPEFPLKVLAAISKWNCGIKKGI